MFDLRQGDCLEVLKTLADNSVDAVVTDPPYELGFMGKGWDSTGIANNPALWSEVLRVLKPGGHLASFGGTRTYHRMACAIEDSGFEVRDQLAWVYAQGFPKSLNVSKVLSDERCRCDETTERSLRPVLDPDVSPAEPAGEKQGEILLACVSEQGVSAPVCEQSTDLERVIQSSLEGRRDLSPSAGQLREREIRSLPEGIDADGASRRLRYGAPPSYGGVDWASLDEDGVRPSQGSSAAQQSEAQLGTLAEQPQPQKRGAWDHCERCGKPLVPDGLGTALKPAWESICLARKPLSEKTVAANVLRWGTGAINVDATRIPTGDKLGGGGEKAETSGQFTNEGWRRPWMDDPIASESFAAKVRANVAKSETLGRFPANLCHDGSDEVLDLFPETAKASGRPRNNGEFKSVAKGAETAHVTYGHDDNGGSAARFFYCAKASKGDRAGSKHPTVKPIKLKQWLCRLITPPGGTILDMFAGSGTTGAAARLEGFGCILIEREAEYIADIQRRMESVENVAAA